MSEDEEIRRDLGHGISSALDSELVTRWLVIAESIGPDGKRGLWLQCHEDMKSWDVFGMLEFARVVETAKEIHDQRPD